MGKSIERDGVFGKYTEHFDDDGNKVGESKIVDGVFGKYVEHTDRHGNKLGESKYREGIFEDYTEHFTREGKKVGESKDREGIFEDYTEHYSSDGKKLGESKFREGILQDYTEHTGDPLPFGHRKGRGAAGAFPSDSGDDDYDEDDFEEGASDDPRAHATPGGKGFWFLATPIVLVGAVGWIIELGPFKSVLGSQRAEQSMASAPKPVAQENALPPSSLGGSQYPTAPAPALAPLPPAVTEAEAAQPALESYHYVTGLDPNGDNWLALKAAPNAASERLRQLPPDTLLTILSSQEPWQEVRLVSGETGWVHGRYLACCKTGSNTASSNVMPKDGLIESFAPSVPHFVKGTNVRFREAPYATDETKVVAVGRDGDPLAIVGRVSQPDGFDWYQIRLDGGVLAFVRADLVTTASPSSSWTGNLQQPGRADYVMTFQLQRRQDGLLTGSAHYGGSYNCSSTWTAVSENAEAIQFEEYFTSGTGVCGSKGFVTLNKVPNERYRLEWRSSKNAAVSTSGIFEKDVRR